MAFLAVLGPAQLSAKDEESIRVGLCTIDQLTPVVVIDRSMPIEPLTDLTRLVREICDSRKVSHVIFFCHYPGNNPEQAALINTITVASGAIIFLKPGDGFLARAVGQFTREGKKVEVITLS